MKKALIILALVASTAQAQTVYKLTTPKTITASHVKVFISNDGNDETSHVTYVYCDSIGNPLKIAYDKDVPSDKLQPILQKTLSRGVTLNDFFSELGILVSEKRTVETRTKIQKQ